MIAPKRPEPPPPRFICECGRDRAGKTGVCICNIVFVAMLVLLVGGPLIGWLFK